MCTDVAPSARVLRAFFVCVCVLLRGARWLTGWLAGLPLAGASLRRSCVRKRWCWHALTRARRERACTKLTCEIKPCTCMLACIGYVCERKLCEIPESGRQPQLASSHDADDDDDDDADSVCVRLV